MLLRASESFRNTAGCDQLTHSPSTTLSVLRLPAAIIGMSLITIAASWFWLGMPIELPRAPIDVNAKLQCVSYSPFRRTQTWSAGQVSREQIAEDLARLAKVSECVRTYATNFGLDQIPELAAKAGLKVMQGIWLGRDRQKNLMQISTGIRLAKEYPQSITALVVGSEVLLRGEMTETDLADTIRSIKAKVAVPVTYADSWDIWLQHRELNAVVDFVTVHILPFWENTPVSADLTASHVHSVLKRMADAFPRKEIVIGEIGWPSEGRMREAALPSRVNQAKVTLEILDLARREGFRLNWFEAYDEGWKQESEGTVGGYWGLFDSAHLKLKYPVEGTISNYPLWKLQMSSGLLLAILIFSVAWTTSRAECRQPSIISWFAVAVSATSAGVLLGVAAQKMFYECYGAGSWSLEGALFLASTTSPILAAQALMSGRHISSFSALLGPKECRPKSILELTHSVVFLLVVLIGAETAIALVFDPRNKDFPFASLTMGTVPFAAIALLNRSNRADRPLAESVFAGLFVLSAIYTGLNEGASNWQSLWTCAAYVSLALALFTVRDSKLMS